MIAIAGAPHLVRFQRRHHHGLHSDCVRRLMVLWSLVAGMLMDWSLLRGQARHTPRKHMKTSTQLESSDVQKIAAAAAQEASTNQWAVSIAIVDAGGHLLAFQRLDGAAPLSAKIAVGKARMSALGQKETKVYEEMINGGRAAFLSAPMDSMLEGGVPIMHGGQCIGAVGVSGVKSPEDAQVARAGIAALA